MVGGTKDENAIFLAPNDAVWKRTLSEAELKERVGKIAGADTDAVLTAYRQSYPTMNPAELLITITTASNFWVRSVILAERKAAQGKAPVFKGRAAEAEAVYREDLGLGGALPRAQIHPDNLWALRGLLDCLNPCGESAEATLIRQRLDFAAARADQPVSVLLCPQQRWLRSAISNGQWLQPGMKSGSRRQG